MTEFAHRYQIDSSLGNVSELWPSCLQGASNGGTCFSHLVSSPGSVMTSDTHPLHLATSPDSVATCDIHIPHPTSPAAMVSDSIDFMSDIGSPHLLSSERAFRMPNGMPNPGVTSNAQAGKHSMHSLFYTNAGDSNAIDASSAMRSPSSFGPADREDMLAGPAFECTRLDVTRAGSECSLTDEDVGDDDGLGAWCEEDLRLMAEILAAECSLLQVQNGLDSRISTAEHEKMDKAMHMRQSADPIFLDGEDKSHSPGSSSFGSHEIHKCLAKGTSQESYEGMMDRRNFARQHPQGPRYIRSERTIRKQQGDPTVALQGSLQDLLLVARVNDQDEQEKDVHASSQLESGNKRAEFDRYEDRVFGMDGSTSTMKNARRCKRRDTETAALKKELRLMSLELAEAKKDLASQKREAHFCCRKKTQQTVAEEMYCKETIQRLIRQMQAEMEQWSQMQGILYNLQEELGGLSETQKLWEERAYQAEAQLLSLQKELHEWRCRARSAHEELVVLRCERQILKNRIEMMEESQVLVPKQKLEEPRRANVGTQHEEFGACESFVHSRNESGRSSVDLGTSSQRSFRKSIKKSMSFTSNKENINTSKFRFGNRRVPTKAEATGSEFPRENADAGGSKGKIKNEIPLAHFINVKLHCSEHPTGQERKKARLFPFKDKLGGASSVCNGPFNTENVKDGLAVGHASSSRQDDTDHFWSLKLKSSLPSAPTSTPSRVLFGNIVNITNP